MVRSDRMKKSRRDTAIRPGPVGETRQRAAIRDSDAGAVPSARPVVRHARSGPSSSQKVKRKIGAMGKVRDEVSAQKPSKPNKAGSGSRPRGVFVRFLANLVRTDLYKPIQGRHARLYTAWACA